jgi:hypothetical protein
MPEDAVALALSGGGIRSATFSLGVIQALGKSERNALDSVDIVSTVSGGGYIGCFLRSLFMPDDGRGILPKVAPDKKPTSKWKAAVEDQYNFARMVLASGTEATILQWKKADGSVVWRRNPLWWLREHSRYLAPNGPTDYAYAFAYIARNWFAMLYIFIIASLAIFGVIVGAEAAYASACATRASVAHTLAKGWCVVAHPSIGYGIRVSPVLFLTLPVLAASLILGVAYWMTQAMSPNEKILSRQWKNLLLPALGTTVASVAVIALAAWMNSLSQPTAPADALAGRTWLNWLGIYAPHLPLTDFGAGHAGKLLAAVLLFGLVLTLAATGTALGAALAFAPKHGVGMTIEIRSRLTRWLANSIEVFICVLILAIIDTIGAQFAERVPKVLLHLQTGGIAALIPALAALFKKLPDWFGRSTKIASGATVQRFLPALSAIAGMLVYGLIAVMAATIVHALAWHGQSWTLPDWYPFTLFLAAVTGLAILAGTATGFINVSSLHFLYASRLTRAFLGATNNQRLEKAARPLRPRGSITDTDRGDYIPPLYFRLDLPAPLHLINVTLNETVDRNSELVSRDRKGASLVVGPEGIEVGAKLLKWDEVGTDGRAEQLSLGQWCAISGAAISSGMGRLTSLGYALTLTFANVRLGYWWWSPHFCDVGRTPLSYPAQFAGSWFSTFVYLWNEMTARYSRFYTRKYLTDGGHFENTAAYRLIERGVPLIIVCDNGADPEYRFADLENLVRKVRLDFGGDTELLGGSQLTDFLGRFGNVDRSIFVDPDESAGDWRDRFASTEARGYVLVLRAKMPDRLVHVVWLKPRVLSDVPPDILSYASANRPFPQQPTGDQFFDEAQWESYRALGEICMNRLLTACPGLLS